MVKKLSAARVEALAAWETCGSARDTGLDLFRHGSLSCLVVLAREPNQKTSKDCALLLFRPWSVGCSILDPSNSTQKREGIGYRTPYNLFVVLVVLEVVLVVLEVVLVVLVVRMARALSS